MRLELTRPKTLDFESSAAAKLRHSGFVLQEGLEPTRPKTPDPKSGAAAKLRHWSAESKGIEPPGRNACHGFQDRFVTQLRVLSIFGCARREDESNIITHEWTLVLAGQPRHQTGSLSVATRKVARTRNSTVVMWCWSCLHRNMRRQEVEAGSTHTPVTGCCLRADLPGRVHHPIAVARRERSSLAHR